MRVTGLACTRCKTNNVLAIWPGTDPERSQLPLFTVLPGRPVKAWCERCWLERFGADARLPQRGSQRKNVRAG